MIYTRHHKRAAAIREANRATHAAELAIVNGQQPPSTQAVVAEPSPPAAQQQPQPAQPQNKHQQHRR